MEPKVGPRRCAGYRPSTWHPNPHTIFLFPAYVFFFFNFLYLFERLREANRDLAVCCFTPQVPAILWVWTESEPAATSFVGVPFPSGRDPGTEAVAHCVPRCILAGSWSLTQKQESSPGTVVGMWVPQRLPNSCTKCFRLIF